MAKRKGIVSGIICTEPKVDQTSRGKERLRFSIAVNEVYGKQKTTTFINCTIYDLKLLEFVTQYFDKGKPIEVEGKLNPYQYVGKDGQTRKDFELIVDNVDFCPYVKEKDETDDQE